MTHSKRVSSQRAASKETGHNAPPGAIHNINASTREIRRIRIELYLEIHRNYKLTQAIPSYRQLVVIEQIDPILLVALLRRKRKKIKRRMWVREIFSRRRQQQGEYNNLLQEMRVSDPESNFKYLRMSKERFDSLLSKVCTFVIAILTLRNLR